MAAPSTRYRTEADDSSGKEQKLVIPTDGEARVEGIVNPEPASALQNHTKLEKLAFLEEKVLILVHPPQSEHDTARLISVGVNGKKQYILAGEPKWVRRKYVEQLVKARPDHISHRSDDPFAERANIMSKISTSRYNFDVLQDTAKGAAWLAELRKKHLGR